ncbi:MAG: Uma2 family endonuclease, partial [Chloroflexaceae bacterium]|nr:Uma2 family endonuclease [Chloroflexaceae bacterium]
PCLVIEISSRSTRREDLGKKKFKYAELGVEEYILFDPLSEYLKPPLQGFRLEGDAYVPIQPDAQGGLLLTTLNLRLLREQRMLSMFDAATGERLLRPDDVAEAHRAEAAARRAAETARREEAAARRAAEARASTLEAELAQLRAELQRLRGSEDV